MDNVDNMDTDGRSVEAIQVHRHAGANVTASTDEQPPAALRLPRVGRFPFRLAYPQARALFVQ